MSLSADISGSTRFKESKNDGYSEPQLIKILKYFDNSLRQFGRKRDGIELLILKEF